VSRSAQIGNGICRKAQRLLEGTPVEDRQTDLLKIARLKDHEQQVRIAQKIHDSKGQGYRGGYGYPNYFKAKKAVDAERIAAEPVPLPAGPFRVIVADPPWHYKKRKDDATKRENTDYATMGLDDLKALDVKAITEEHSVLWLWATNAHLQQAFAVAHAWGFTYKTLLTWDKTRIGMGEWLRGQTEHCLFCTRGRPTVTLSGQTTLIRETRQKHSAKPEAFYQLVESLCPGSKVELFCRGTARVGWHGWGADCRGALP
jgi:N6-adenosine-specific RNA methylase IME4